MKIAFDENVPIAMVKVFQTFANEKQFQKIVGGKFEVESAKDYTPSPSDADYIKKNDAPWIRRFSAAGGRVVISGNTNMKNKPQERLALVQEGMVVIFFENRWNNWKFFSKCALLMHWWPVIATRIKRAKPGSFYHIPLNFVEDGKLRKLSNEDPKMLRLVRSAKRREKGPKRSARKPKNQVGYRQEAFTFHLEAKDGSHGK